MLFRQNILSYLKKILHCWEKIYKMSSAYNYTCRLVKHELMKYKLDVQLVPNGLFNIMIKYFENII